MPETRLSKRTRAANGQRSTKEFEEFEESEEFEISDESEKSEEFEEPAVKRRQLRINSKTPSSSLKRPSDGQNAVPGRSSGRKTQVKDDDFSICERLDFRLKAYIDQDGDHSEYKHLPHMPHVFFMVCPYAKHPDGDKGTLSSRYDRIFLSSSQQRLNLPPEMSSNEEDSDGDISSHSDIERLIRERDQAAEERDQAIRERDQAIQERDQATEKRDQVIEERNAFNKVVQTGNPYYCHSPVEFVGRYASSESHALLCNGFMRKWEVDSSECKDKLERATDLSARHAIIKANLDDIYQLSQDFDAQAKWMSARHTSRPL